MFSNDPIKPANFTITVLPERDFLPGAYGEFDLAFVGGDSGWGLGAYGSSPWGGAAEASKAMRLKQNRVKAMRFSLYHQERYKTPRISGWEVEAAASFKPRMD